LPEKVLSGFLLLKNLPKNLLYLLNDCLLLE